MAECSFLFQRMNGTGDGVLFQQNEAVAFAAGAGVHHPQPLHLLAVGHMGVTKEENVCVSLFGLTDGGTVALLHPPQVAVGEQYSTALQGYQTDEGIGGPSIAVAGDLDHGQLRIGVADLLGVILEVAQVDDQVGIMGVDGIHHAAPGAVGVGEYKNFQKGHLHSFVAYTGMKSYVRRGYMKGGNGTNPVDLVKNREALNKLAQSQDAQRLMELLGKSGGVQDAAKSAAAGDPSALMNMMNQLMSTGEGARLVERLSQKAKESGLAE